MRNTDEIKTNDILVKCCGYSMIYYEFYLVLGINDKSIRLQKLGSKIHESTTDAFRPYVVPDTNLPMGKPIRRKVSTYMGSVWDGKPCQEDLLD